MPYQSVDSAEAARAMVMEWSEGSYRMGRLPMLLEIIKKCKTEDQLRWVAEALSTVLRTHARPATRKMTLQVKSPAAPSASPKELEESHFVELGDAADMSQVPAAAPTAVPAPATRNLPPPQTRPAAPAAAALEPGVRNPPTRSAAPPASPVVPPPPKPEEVAVRRKPPSQVILPQAKEDTRMRRAGTRSIQPPLPTAPETIPVIDPKSLAAGVNAEVLADIFRVDQCRRIFESTHQQIETWEVFCLVMIEGDKTRVELERILALRAVGDALGFTEGATELFQKLLAIRAKFSKFVQELRAYVSTLEVGHFGKETTEMALAFMIASGRGREAGSRWLTEPKRYVPEAAGRWEGLIDTSMKYQTAMQQVKAAKK